MSDDRFTLDDELPHRPRHPTPDELRERNTRLAEVVRKLKASNDPANESALIKQLRHYHHPDIKGLLECLVAKLPAPRAKRGGL